MGSEFKDLFGDWESSGDNSPFNGDTPPEEIENRLPRDLQEKEVKVIGVFEHTAIGDNSSAQTFVLVQDANNRQVFIFIGRYEAFAISMAIEGDTPERPMTHDLFHLILNRLGAKIERIIIDDIWENTFYAKLFISMADKKYEIDCRPSDAIALAIRAKAPIMMAEAVIAASHQEI